MRSSGTDRICPPQLPQLVALALHQALSLQTWYPWLRSAQHTVPPGVGLGVGAGVSGGVGGGVGLPVGLAVVGWFVGSEVGWLEGAFVGFYKGEMII